MMLCGALVVGLVVRSMLTHPCCIKRSTWWMRLLCTHSYFSYYVVLVLLVGLRRLRLRLRLLLLLVQAVLVQARAACAARAARAWAIAGPRLRSTRARLSDCGACVWPPAGRRRCRGWARSAVPGSPQLPARRPDEPSGPAGTSRCRRNLFALLIFLWCYSWSRWQRALLA